MMRLSKKQGTKQMAILQVKNLVKTYGKGDTTVTALGGVSFGVEKGEFVAIIGTSGSGKSTLMHLIGGVDRPTSGNVVVDGNEIFKQNESKLAIFRRRNIGLIYQFYNLIPTLTAEENITLPCLLDHRKPDKRKLRAILETIGLTDRAKHLPNELSGGQQQRVSIGRALVNDPALILADEPTGNLDSKSSREIIDLLKRSNKRYNQTLIVITHDEKIALQADRIITISDGQIVRDEVVRG
jgi:putative ABC transport system ATP-binding protein